MTVYYTPGNPDVQAMVTRFQRDNPALTVEALAFEDAASLDSRLSDESEEGSGPDVVLFSDAAALDTQQMAAAGDFADLAPCWPGTPLTLRRTISPCWTRAGSGSASFSCRCAFASTI